MTFNNPIEEAKIIQYVKFEDLKNYIKNSAVEGEKLVTSKDGKFYSYLCTNKNDENPVWIEVLYAYIDPRLKIIANAWHDKEKNKEDLLCLLAEECSELAQACLKYRRAKLGLTPKTEEETLENIAEEIADVSILMDQLLYVLEDVNICSKVQEIRERKTDRYYRRTFININEE